MGIQTLFRREARHLIRNLCQCILRIVGILHLLGEIVHRQRAVEPRRPAGRQGVVRSREIVAQCLRAVLSQEDGSGIADSVQIIKGIVHAELKMLRRNLVGDIDCGLDIFR